MQPQLNSGMGQPPKRHSWVPCGILGTFLAEHALVRLVGVLVDVMRVISATEKEGITISYLANEFREKMDQLLCIQQGLGLSPTLLQKGALLWGTWRVGGGVVMERGQGPS